MACPNCGSKTITRSSNISYPTSPPILLVHQWCGCGYQGPDEPQRTESADARAMRAWREANAAPSAGGQTEEGE